jgi:Leucine-rich repeat (LRR) protein
MGKGFINAVLVLVAGLLLTTGAMAAKTPYCKDLDLDGYGDPTDCVSENEAGYVEDDTDCNDNDATINPGVLEICGDGIDNNCLNGVDEGCSGDNKQYYYLDADGDGYGNPEIFEYATNPSTGYVTDFTDCNDTDAMVNPGMEEDYSDLVDQNCDGKISMFSDPNLEACVSEYTGGSFDPALLASLSTINCSKRSISDITGIEYLSGLSYLNLFSNKITNISSIIYLTELRTLYLTSNNISDISPLGSLTELNLLWLNANNVNDFSPLANLTSLSNLNIGGNALSGGTNFLINLTGLIYLNAGFNYITDISSLSNHAALRELYLQFNSITSIDALGNLINLDKLLINSNNVDDISGLVNLTNLTQLDVSGNPIINIYPLANLTNLLELGVSEISATDFSPISNLQGLTEINLGFNYTLSDISFLSNLTELKYVYLLYNSISDLTPLSNKNYFMIRLDNNEITDLSQLSNTVTNSIYIGYNCITDFSPVSHIPYVFGTEHQCY